MPLRESSLTLQVGVGLCHCLAGMEVLAPYTAVSVNHGWEIRWREVLRVPFYSLVNLEL